MKITGQNLSFVTNAEDPTLEIRYEITKLPQYGVIQRFINLEKKNSGETFNGSSLWQVVEQFTSQQISREEIRYLHTNQSPSHDFFKVKTGNTKNVLLKLN